jgi:anti-anti-sigma factor
VSLDSVPAAVNNTGNGVVVQFHLDQSELPSFDVESAYCLSLIIDRRGPDITIAVAGELDALTADLLIDAARIALRWPARALLLNLSGVTFCGVAGVRALTDVDRMATDTGAQLVLREVRTSVRNVLDLVTSPS